MWQFEVTLDLGQKSILTMVNEGNTIGNDPNVTTFSWTFKTALGISARIELFYQRSPDGIFLTRVDTYTGSQLALSQRYDPPVLTLKFLKVGHWEHKGSRVSHKGTEPYHVVNTARKVRVTVPAGTFDAFEVQGQESTGGQSTEYWVENVGLVGMVQTHASGRVMTAKLVRSWRSVDEALAVGTKVFLHRRSWGCTVAELLGEVYRLQANASHNREASAKLERIVQQRQCIQIDDLKGYIVHRRGDGVAINHLEVNNQDMLLWVPKWSLTPCLGVVCR